MGIKKRSLLRQPSREDLLVRRPKRVKTIDSTVRLHRAGARPKDTNIAFLFIFFITACFTSVFSGSHLSCLFGV